MQSNIGKGGTKGTQTAFGLLGCGDLNIAKTLLEERDGNDTEILILAKVLSNSERVKRNSGIGTHKILGPVEAEFSFAD